MFQAAEDGVNASSTGCERGAWRRVARDGLWAACAVRLDWAPALTRPLSRTAAGQRFFLLQGVPSDGRGERAVSISGEWGGKEGHCDGKVIRRLTFPLDLFDGRGLWAGGCCCCRWRVYCTAVAVWRVVVRAMLAMWRRFFIIKGRDGRGHQRPGCGGWWRSW